MARGWIGEPGEAGDRARSAFDRGTNPDYLEIKPSGLGNQIQVRQISTPKVSQKDDPIPLTEFMRVPPLYSKYKVIWVEQVERINKDSANSLLKPLEEPPPYVRIILSSSEVGQIPRTILSRCLVINCELPDQAELEKLVGTEHSDILVFAGSAPGAAKDVLANSALYTQLLSFLNRMMTASPYHALVLGEEFRTMAEQWEKASPAGQRNTNARIVELLALGVSRLYPTRPGALALLIDAHKMIVGNVQAGLMMDATLTRLMQEQS